MLTKRITNNMNSLDIICALGESNPGAMNVLASTITGDFRLWSKKVNKLDELNIYGNEIWTLFDNCCNSNPELFNYALELLIENYFPLEEFANNLVLKDPIKIFTDSQAEHILNSYGINYIKRSGSEFCTEHFSKRYNEAREKETRIIIGSQPGDDQ